MATTEVPIPGAARVTERRSLGMEDITVPVSADIFANHPRAAFYLGIVATPEGIINPHLYKAAAKLRYNVYVKEKGLMHPTLRTRLLQSESDGEDRRSVHMVVVKNNGPDEQPHLIGSSRLIIKRHAGDLLPVERLYPEAFALGAAAVNSAEISRFIARSANKREQHTVARGLIRALAIRTAMDTEQPVYAIADRQLMGMLRVDRVSFDALSDPKVLEEYSTPQYNLPNAAIGLDAHTVLAAMTGPEAEPWAQHMYQGIFANQGVGYFDANMVHESLSVTR